MKLPLLLLFLCASTAAVSAALTEADIIAKELEWAKTSVRHYRQGFNSKHPLNWAVHDEAFFEMPKHEPIVLSEQSDGRKPMKHSNLRMGAKS